VGVHADTYRPNVQRPAFVSVIVLLLGVWNARRSNVSVNIDQEMADVHKCLSLLKALEERWIPAGRLLDVFNKLAAVGDLPIPQAELRTKRPRDHAETAATSNISTASSSGGTPAPHAIPPLEERAVAGSRRVRAVPGSHAESESTGGNTAGSFGDIFAGGTGGELAGSMYSDAALPLHNSELGRMDAGDALMWDPSAFSLAEPSTPPTAPWQPAVQPMDSMFCQNPEAPGPAPGSGTGLTHDTSTSNLGALFGFGGGAQQPTMPPAAPPPQADFVFGLGASTSMTELLQSFDAVPDEHGWGPDVWMGLPTECVHCSLVVTMDVDVPVIGWAIWTG
jgi:hypothetical protein